MASSLSSVVSLNVSANIVNPLNVGGATATLSSSFGTSLITGVLAGQADKAWWDHRTLAASASETLDLAGSLLDQFGATITFARVKVLVVSADAANTNNVVVGGAGSNTFIGLFGSATHTAIVRPGATVAWITGNADATGYAVTPSTGDLLQIANSSSGSSVSYTVAIIGAST
jgi:hypothetical protein